MRESQGSEPTGRPHERAQRRTGGRPREHAHGQRGPRAVAGIIPHYHVRYASGACGESRGIETREQRDLRSSPPA